MDKRYTVILEKLKRAEEWGKFKILENGTLLMGFVPHVGSAAWFHEIFTPLENGEIALLEKELNIPLSKDMIDFYKCTNGLRIFSNKLSISGLRRNNSRDCERAREPFSIFTPNIDERPKDAKKNFLFFGFYTYDGTRLYTDIPTNKIYHCEGCESLKIKNQWDNFWQMLKSETDRLESFFEKGKLLNENADTTPPNVYNIKTKKKRK